MDLQTLLILVNFMKFALFCEAVNINLTISLYLLQLSINCQWSGVFVEMCSVGTNSDT